MVLKFLSINIPDLCLSLALSLSFLHGPTDNAHTHTHTVAHDCRTWLEPIKPWSQELQNSQCSAQSLIYNWCLINVCCWSEWINQWLRWPAWLWVFPGLSKVSDEILRLATVLGFPPSPHHHRCLSSHREPHYTSSDLEQPDAPISSEIHLPLLCTSLTCLLGWPELLLMFRVVLECILKAFGPSCSKESLSACLSAGI